MRAGCGRQRSSPRQPRGKASPPRPFGRRLLAGSVCGRVARSTMREAVAAVAAGIRPLSRWWRERRCARSGSGTRGEVTDSLVKSVVAQQLSTKAADTISGRPSEALDH